MAKRIPQEYIDEIRARLGDMMSAHARLQNAKAALRENPEDRAARKHADARALGYAIAAEPFTYRAPEYVVNLLEHVDALEAEIARLSSNEEGAA